jgi:hypothetical protein
MTPGLRKLVLTTHITVSVGWIGAAAAFLVLAIAGLTHPDAGVVRGAYLLMNLIGLYLIVPLSLAALATGLIQSLGTHWGLFRHYWVLAKFLLTTAAAGTLPGAELGGVGFELLRASGLGILVLLAITALSVYKPWGRTPYGRRLQQRGRYQGSISPETGGVEAISDHDNVSATIGAGVPPGLAFVLAGCIGVSVVVVIVTMVLTGHVFHHGH